MRKLFLCINQRKLSWHFLDPLPVTTRAKSLLHILPPLSMRPSVRPFVHTYQHAAPRMWISVKFYIGAIYENLSRKSKFV